MSSSPLSAFDNMQLYEEFIKRAVEDPSLLRGLAAGLKTVIVTKEEPEYEEEEDEDEDEVPPPSKDTCCKICHKFISDTYSYKIYDDVINYVCSDQCADLYDSRCMFCRNPIDSKKVIKNKNGNFCSDKCNSSHIRFGNIYWKCICGAIITKDMIKIYDGDHFYCDKKCKTAWDKYKKKEPVQYNGWSFFHQVDHVTVGKMGRDGYLYI